MKNELGRKLTSLTLMTVMLTSLTALGATNAFVMPEALAETQLLYVSADNADFGNTIGGVQIVEIIVADPTRSDVNSRQGEPTVEMNGDVIRMAQGNDGFWYAYVADTTAVGSMDSTSGKTPLDFGVALAAGAALPGTGSGDTASIGVTPDADATIYYASTIIKGEPTLSLFNTTDRSLTIAQAANTEGTDDGLYRGQINVTLAAQWPFIQTFDMSEGEQEIILEKPGADEVVVIDYDQPGDFASFSLDRNEGPLGAEVHITINDFALNLDPTEDDTWIFRTAGTAALPLAASYNASDKTGAVGFRQAFSNSTNGSGFDDNGILEITLDGSASGTSTLAYDATLDDPTADKDLVFWETGPNTGVFVNGDNVDDANVIVATSAKGGMTGTVDYNDSAQSYTARTYTGTIDMVESDAGEEWNSGEEISVILTDPDLNLNTYAADDQAVVNSTKIPTIIVGTPLSLTVIAAGGSTGGQAFNGTMTLDSTSKIGTFTANTTAKLYDRWTIKTGLTVAAINAINTSTTNTQVVSWDLSSMCSDAHDGTSIDLLGINSTSAKGSAVITHSISSVGSIGAQQNGITCEVNGNVTTSGTYNIAMDIMSFGDGDHDGIYRIEVEETGDDTGVFEGGVEYIMLNQLNYDRTSNQSVTDAYFNITTIGDSVDLILKADMTGTDAPRVKYADTDGDGISTGIADQVDAPTHSGTVDMDQDNYKVADTITITVTDMDLNVDSSLVDTYVTFDDDFVGDNDNIGDHILDVYFADKHFNDTCNNDFGLFAQDFVLTETGIATGVFEGAFQVPENYCGGTSNATSTSTTGEDIFVNYNDYRDAGGNSIEVGDSATVTANSGSIALDRSVYPVPFDASTYKAHDDIMLSEGNITLTVQVTDQDYNTSPTGEDTIPAGKTQILGYRGSDFAALESSFALTETEADSGVFEYEFTLEPTDVIMSTALKQGDVITAVYVDPTDATGNSYNATDSSTLDQRSGSLLSDKSVYVIGSDAIITLVEPDLNFDSGSIESYSLGLVEWDSDAGTKNLNDSCTSSCTFDPEPSSFRETGSDTGIFQTVIEIPTNFSGTNLDRGEKIDLEYVDYGPSGEANAGDSTEDIELSIYTSNFGATIELDSKVYTWTDRVFVTIVAPDWNTDSSLVDEIGGATDKSLTAQTRDNKLTAYKLVENGADTGIFIGEITLTGFGHDADGDGDTTEGPTATFDAAKAGPTDGLLGAKESDGITVSFEYTEDATVVSSSLIRWNVGETSFGEDAYLSSSSAVVTVLDPDMNMNPDTVENFKIDIYSDSDSGGIQLTVSETNESTGVFEGTVFFTTTDASSGHTLRVSEGDSITADYTDHTLPEPYSTSDDIDVSATAVIGTSTPPLERAPVANARVVDAFGNSLAEVSVDQQVQIEADLVNGQDGDQSFAYLVQVQDSDGVTVSLAWITGQLAAGQSFSPALSWIPDASGSYEATVFVWESVDNPTALSDTTSVSITVV